MSLLLPLILTIAIEACVLYALRERRKQVYWALVVMNVMTNVPLNLYVQHVSYSLTVIVIGELLVILTEALCYRIVTRNWRQSLTYSALCNAVSYFMGALMLNLYQLLT